MAQFVIDAHTLLFFLGGIQRIGADAKAALDDPGNELIIPAIALAEALWIASSRSIGISVHQVVAAIDADARITVYPLDREVVELAHNLTSIPEMHDRQIAATTLVLNTHGATSVLLTKDSAIIAAGVVPTAW